MRRRSRRRAVGWLAAILVAGIQPALLACPICFQVDPGPVTDGVRAAVLVLVGVTSGVLVGFGAFIVRFVKNEGRSGVPGFRDSEVPRF